MKIRVADAKDIEFCARLDAKTFNEDKERMLTEFTKKFNDKDYTTLIAEEDSKSVGFCTFVTRKWNNTVYIEMLIVEEQYRNKRIGTELLNEIKKFSKNNNIRRLFFDVGTDNIRAIDFYLKNGFELTGFIKNFFDERKDVFILSRPI